MSYFSNENPIQEADINKSRFNLSYQNLITDDMGSLIPVLVKEIVPGDNFNISSEVVIKMAPMVTPAFSYIDINMRYFYVPYRLVVDNFDKFIMGDTTVNMPYTEFAAATINANKPLYSEGSLLDYFGGAVLPSITPQPDAAHSYPSLNLLPFRAYQLIYQEYYRPKEIDRVEIDKTARFYDDAEPADLTEVEKLLQKRYVSNFGDYFSSAKVDDTNVDVNVPATIEALRKAEGFYRFFQKMKYAGKKYADYMRVFFGQTIDNDLISEPLYLGGENSVVQIADVMQTSPTVDAPLGNYAGKGNGYLRSNGEKLYAKEHGILIGLMDITPRITYANYHKRMMLNRNYYDFFQPQLETAYRETIKIGEGLHDLTSVAAFNSGVYGYVEPYHELKYSFNEAHGQFHNSIAYWSAIQRSNDNLTDALMHSPTDTNVYKVVTEDMFAVTDEPQFYAQVFHTIDALRPLKRNLFM